MSTHALTKTAEKTPTLFEDFFKPWNEWFENGGNFWNRTLSVPAVNITENKSNYEVSLAVPGVKKDDFRIDVEGNILTISSKKEETKEEKEKKFSRKEYNYSSFSRSFSLPDEVNKEKIDAVYQDGVLKLTLPKTEEAKKAVTGRHIVVK